MLEIINPTTAISVWKPWHSVVKAPNSLGFVHVCRAFSSHILLSVSWHFCQLRTGGHRCWRQVWPHFYSPLHFQRLRKNKIKTGGGKGEWGRRRKRGDHVKGKAGQGEAVKVRMCSFSFCRHSPGKVLQAPLPPPHLQTLRHKYEEICYEIHAIFSFPHYKRQVGGKYLNLFAG